MNKKKRGRIEVSEELYFQPGAMAEVFKHFLPLKIEFDYDKYVVYGLCEEFEEIEQEVSVPQYMFTITRRGIEIQAILERFK